MNLIALLCLVVSVHVHAETLMGRVIGVADGDTLTVLDNNKGLTKIRPRNPHSILFAAARSGPLVSQSLLKSRRDTLISIHRNGATLVAGARSTPTHK